MRRSRTQKPERDKGLRTNHRIRARRVLVINEKGEKIGEFLTPDAVNLAEERGLDLIEVAPNSDPPVCKIGDYGRMMYEKKKKDSKSRKNQTIINLKEVKLRPRTNVHDFQVKVKHARRFLDAGDKVKVTIRFRGREMAHQEIGQEQSLKLYEAVKDISNIEMHPKMDGRQMFMILAPLKSKE